tara:strand:+ start:76 stop:315 length:240 start_codon:yes stop_codon:yes gene_type:complete
MADKKQTEADKRYLEMMSKDVVAPASTEIVEAEVVSTAEANRAKYPEIAKFVDEVRKYFPGAKVTSIKPINDKENKDNG